MKAGNRPYRSPDDLPSVIPVFPLPAALLLPRAELPLNIFEPRYVAMIDAALAGDRIVGMIQPDEGKGPGSLGPSLCTVGCAGRLTSFAETGDGRYMVTLTGIARIVHDVHYASDVLAGAGIGWFYGYVMPKLLHFRNGKLVTGERTKLRAAIERFTPSFVPTMDGGGVLSVSGGF